MKYAIFFITSFAALLYVFLTKDKSYHVRFKPTSCHFMKLLITQRQSKIEGVACLLMLNTQPNGYNN